MSSIGRSDQRCNSKIWLWHVEIRLGLDQLCSNGQVALLTEAHQTLGCHCHAVKIRNLGEILVHIKAIVILHCREPSGLGREFLTAAAVGDGSRLGIPGGNVLIQEFFDGCHELTFPFVNKATGSNPRILGSLLEL